MKTQIIQLESHDDLISTRDKMSWSKAPRILLVWPRKGRVLERQLDMIALQRHAQTLGAQLGVVSTSSEVHTHAHEAGVPVFRTPAQAQKSVWRRPRGRKKMPLALLERPRVAASALRERSRLFRPAGIEAPGVRFAAFLSSVLAIFALLLFFLPSARLELTPQRQNQRLELDLLANPEIQSVNLAGGLPAFAVSAVVEGGDSLASSGSAALPDQAASGEVEFTNLTTTELRIPAGTILSTLDSTPLRFETRQDVLLAAGVGKTLRVGVRALVPGRQGNVPAGSLRAVEGDTGLKTSVTNPAALSGGSNRSSPSPSAADYAALRAKLMGALLKTAREDLARSLAKGDRLLDGTIRAGKVMAYKADPPEGQPGDSAHIQMQVEFQGLAVHESDLQAVSRSALEASRPAGFVPLNGQISIDFVTDAVVQADGSATWKATAARELEADWNNQAAARRVVGMAPDQASATLQKSLALARAPRIVMAPDWWIRMPFFADRIEVVRR